MSKILKIAVGCLVALLLVCVISAVAIYVKRDWISEKFSGLFGGALDTGRSVAAIQKLDKDFPFTEPSNGEVSEERLAGYISICETLQPLVEKMEALDKNKSGSQQGSWKEAKEAIGTMSDFMKALKVGLETHRMSPREFNFIEEAMRQAASEAEELPADSAQGDDVLARRRTLENMIQEYEKQVEKLQPGESGRAEIEAEISRLKGELEGAGGGLAGPNVKLYIKHRAKLQACDLKGFGAMAMSGVKPEAN